MKQFVVQVPENKVRFFVALVQNLGYLKSEEIEDTLAFEIPDAQKEMVRHRIKTAKPSAVLDWDDAQKKIKLGEGISEAIRGSFKGLFCPGP